MLITDHPPQMQSGSLSLRKPIIGLGVRLLLLGRIELLRNLFSSIVHVLKSLLVLSILRAETHLGNDESTYTKGSASRE